MKTIHRLFPVLFSLLCLSTWLAGCLPTDGFGENTPSPAHTIGTSNLGFTEAWRFQNIAFSPYFEATIPLIYTSDLAVFIPAQRGPACKNTGNTMSISALNLETGLVQWQICHQDGYPKPETETGYLDAEGQKLYLVIRDILYAFRTTDGSLQWQARSFENHTSYYFSPSTSSNPLQILSVNNKLIQVNADTGEVLDEMPYAMEHWFRYGTIEFHRNINEVQAFDLDTMLVRWTRVKKNFPANAQMYFWPLQIEEDIIFLSGGSFFDLVRVNLHSGQVVWELPDFAASNFVLDEFGRLYVLRGDGSLVVMESASGQILDEVNMGGGQLNINNGPFWLVYEKPYLLAYFADSRELIALKEP